MNERIDVYIPAKHIVTLNRQGPSSDTPLGFLVPLGDAGEAKRLETARRWATPYKTYNGVTKEYVTVEALPEREYDNVPLTGFRVADNVRRSRTQNVVWRIEDPRGFELEISSDNFLNLLFESTMTNGEIKDELVWAREKGNNLLVSTSSGLYKTAIENTTRKTSTVSARDVRPGNVVILSNSEYKGKEVEYLGRMFPVSYGYDGNSIKIGKTAIYWFRTDHKLKFGTPTNDVGIFVVSSPKFSSVASTSERTQAECEKIVNVFENSITSTTYDPTHIGAVIKKGATFTPSVVEITRDNMLLTKDLGYGSRVPFAGDYLLARTIEGGTYRIDTYETGKAFSTARAMPFSERDFMDDLLIHPPRKKVETGYYYGFHSPHKSETNKSMSVRELLENPNVTWFAFAVTVATEEYASYMLYV